MPSPWQSEEEDQDYSPRRKSSMSTDPRPKARKRVFILGGDEHQPDSQQSATPPEVPNEDRHDEIKKAVHDAFGSSQNLPPRPRPILRRGDSTPIRKPGLLDASWRPATADDPKERSARSAHERARNVASSVASAPVSRGTSPGPSNHGSGSPSEYSDLYAPGDELASDQTTPGVWDDPDWVPRPREYRTGGLSAILRLRHARESSERRNRRTDFHSGSSTPERQHSPTRNDSPHRMHGLFHKNFRHSTSSLSELIGHASAIGGSIGGKESVSQAMGETRRKKRPTLSPRSHSLANLGATVEKWTHSHHRSRPKHRSEDDVKIQWHVQETISRQKYLIKLCRALMQYGAPPHRLEEYMRMSARSLDIEAQFLFIPGCMTISFDDSRTHTAEVKLVRVKGLGGVDLGKLDDVHQVYKEVVHDLIGTEEATKTLTEIMERKDRFGAWTCIFFWGLASVSVGPWAYESRWLDLGVTFILGAIVGLLKRISLRTELYSNVFTVLAAVIISFLARALGSITHNGQNLFCFSGMTQSALTLILPGYQVLCAALELQSGSIVAGSVRMVHAIIYSLFLGYGITIGTAIYGAMDHNAVSRVSCVSPLTWQWGFLGVPLFAMSMIIINQGKFRQMPVMILIAIAGWVVSHYSSTAFNGDAQVSSSIAAAAVSVLANLYSRLGWTWDVLLRKIANWIKPSDKVSEEASEKSAAAQQAALSSLEDQPVEPPRPAIRQRIYNSLMAASTNVRTSKMRSLHKDPVEHEENASPPPTTPKTQEALDLPVHVSHSLAASAMIPAIWVLVPSGLAVRGSLLQGIVTANALLGKGGSSSTSGSASLNVGYAVLQVGIGITVGLFIGSLVVYPFGKGPQAEGKRAGKAWKMRSGLFSF